MSSWLAKALAAPAFWRGEGKEVASEATLERGPKRATSEDGPTLVGDPLRGQKKAHVDKILWHCALDLRGELVCVEMPTMSGM